MEREREREASIFLIPTAHFKEKGSLSQIKTSNCHLFWSDQRVGTSLTGVRVSPAPTFSELWRVLAKKPLRCPSCSWNRPTHPNHLNHPSLDLRTFYDVAFRPSWMPAGPWADNQAVEHGPYVNLWYHNAED